MSKRGREATARRRARARAGRGSGRECGGCRHYEAGRHGGLCWYWDLGGMAAGDEACEEWAAPVGCQVGSVVGWEFMRGKRG